MPSANASNFAQTAVRLAREARATPTRSHALVATALRYADDVKHFILREYGINRNVLPEITLREIHLSSNITAIHLNLHQVRFFLADLQLPNLRVSNHAHDLAVFRNFFKLRIDIFLTISVFLNVLGERLFLRPVPVLVESPFHLVIQVLSPHSCQCTKTFRC